MPNIRFSVLHLTSTEPWDGPPVRVVRQLMAAQVNIAVPKSFFNVLLLYVSEKPNGKHNWNMLNCVLGMFAQDLTK